MGVNLDRKALIEIAGGEEYVEQRIRTLAEPIAAQKGMTVDELLSSVCYSEGSGFETTYMEAYKAAFLDGVEESILGEQ